MKPLAQDDRLYHHSMNPIEHLLIGWCIAILPRDTTHRDRFLITAAAVIPDIDGLGMLVEIPTRDTAHPLLWWTDYHHILAHNVAAAVLTTLVAFAFAQSARWRTALLACLAFHSHILGDLVGARGPDGYQWPIPYFLPFSRTPELSWDGQWPLNGWQNFVITGVAIVIALCVAWRRGYSPVGLFSRRADAVFVGALRQRFGAPMSS